MAAEFGWESCAKRIREDLERLCDEVERLDLVFQNTKFLGSTHNFPNMHAGVLMACMSKLDFLSLCMSPNSKQTSRMIRFLDTYVAPGKQRENRLIIQLFRHSLMHSGALRFMSNKALTEAYTWRLYWSEGSGGDRHYQITEVDAKYQDQLLTVFRQKNPGNPDPTTHCLHWRLTSFARDLQAGAERFLADVKGLRDKEARLARAYSRVSMEVADT